MLLARGHNDGFESTVLKGVLGGVKQPYNNSPGQKPFLSKKNKTMKSHVPIRDAIIDGLMTVEGANDARNCLGYFLRVCRERVRQVIEEEVDAERASLQPIDLSRLRAFLIELARKGRDGEGLSVAVALTLGVALSEDNGYEVVLYPINSSRRHGGEHEDLEVYLGEQSYAAMEIKDKPFSSSDVTAAATKAWDAGFARFGFIYGYGAGSVSFEAVTDECRREQDERRTYVACLSIEQLMDALLFTVGEVDYEQVRALTVRLLGNAHVKARTQTVARELLREFIAGAEQ